MVTGLDVAADRLNCVALETSGTFAGGRVYAAVELDRLSQWAANASGFRILTSPARLATKTSVPEVRQRIDALRVTGFAPPSRALVA